MSFKDYLGQELAIGDEVIFITPNYRTFTKAVVIGFTKMYVRIEFRWLGRRDAENCLQSPEQLIKVPK